MRMVLWHGSTCLMFFHSLTFSFGKSYFLQAKEVFYLSVLSALLILLTSNVLALVTFSAYLVMQVGPEVRSQRAVQFLPHLHVHDAFVQPLVHSVNDIPDCQSYGGLMPMAQNLL